MGETVLIDPQAMKVIKAATSTESEFLVPIFMK